MFHLDLSSVIPFSPHRTRPVVSKVSKPLVLAPLPLFLISIILLRTIMEMKNNGDGENKGPRYFPAQPTLCPPGWHM